MAVELGTRLQHAWNAFWYNDRQRSTDYMGGYGTSYRPDQTRLPVRAERSIISAVYTRLGIDMSDLVILHVRLDEDDQYLETINSDLNKCLTLSANLDQTGSALIQDAAMSMFSEGVVAIVPVDTTMDPMRTGSYDIKSLRVGKILEWYPLGVRIRLYNEKIGQYQDVTLPKKMVAIVQNPLYSVMNEPNSILQRLIRKLNLLDAVDEQSSSGKMDLIIQLPYTIRSEARQEQAEKRKAMIEMQLKNSKYGIAYIDGTERVTQLNRSVDNNLLSQIEYLTSMLYGQLGLTQSVFDGTADEATMLNYYNRTIGPCLEAFTDEMKRKFLTKTALAQRQSIKYFRDPFKLVPVSELANISDKFTRNEILSPNEVRSIIARKPSKDPAADELRNRNLNQNKNPDAANVSFDPDAIEDN